MMKHDITVTLLNWNGNLLGVTLPQGPKSGRIRVMQYCKYLDGTARYDLAAKIVNQKITNSYHLLNDLSRYYDVLDVKAIEKNICNRRGKLLQPEAIYWE
ncbi:MAG: CRISPR-associated endonuclease Cas1 [Nitrososphaera sp.]|jgi:CRISPR-associated protein Cas1